MRFSTLFVAAAAVVSTTSAASVLSGRSIQTSALSLTADNYYGAPIPPWEPNHTPGWYYGSSIIDIGVTILDELLCFILELLGPRCLQCPPKGPPKDVYVPTFSNYTCAVQASDYLTYGLVDTVADCESMCSTVTNCTFVNTYHDVNGKNGSTQLTCSLFSSCHGEQDADNCGGQTQADGTIDYITDSAGYCKK